MQYYIKFFNKTTNELVGYYKETGKNCISKIPKGIKLFNNVEDAIAIAQSLDEGFIRDADKHYYTAMTCVYGDHTKQPPKEEYKTKQQKEEELKDELEAFIRKNSSEVGK